MLKQLEAGQTLDSLREEIDSAAGFGMIQIAHRVEIEDTDAEIQLVYVTVYGNEALGYVASDEEWFVASNHTEPEFYLVYGTSQIYTDPAEAIASILPLAIKRATEQGYDLDVELSEGFLLCKPKQGYEMPLDILPEVYRLQIAHKMRDTGVCEVRFIKVVGNQKWGYRASVAVYFIRQDMTLPRYSHSLVESGIFDSPSLALASVFLQAIDGVVNDELLLDAGLDPRGVAQIISAIVAGVPAVEVSHDSVPLKAEQPLAEIEFHLTVEPVTDQPKEPKPFSSMPMKRSAESVIETLPELYRLQVGHKLVGDSQLLIRSVIVQGCDQLGYKAYSVEYTAGSKDALESGDILFDTTIFQTPHAALLDAAWDAVKEARGKDFTLDAQVIDGKIIVNIPEGISVKLEPEKQIKSMTMSELLQAILDDDIDIGDDVGTQA